LAAWINPKEGLRMATLLRQAGFAISEKMALFSVMAKVTI
jgi:hypothetical protein